jgi:O-succinylbenzoic acid--CoA ligase
MPEVRRRIEAAAQRHADQPALINDAEVLTWRQLGALARIESAKLRRLEGYDLGNVAICGSSGYDYLMALLAAFDLGVTSILLDPRSPADWLKQQLSSLDCQLYLHCDEAPTLTVDKMLCRSFEASAKLDQTSKPVDFSVFHNRLSTITFTSGSTGSARPIMHLLRHHYYSATGSNANLSVEPGDRWLLSLPLFHVGGLSVMFRCLFGGGAMVLADKSIGVAEQIIRDQVTHLSLVPTQLVRLLRDDRVSEIAQHLKVILVGGGPISDTLLNKARAAGLIVYPTYGSTEMASQIATAGPGHENCLRALTHRELNISDDGEILVRGQTLGWGQKSGANWNLLSSRSGWYHTRDVGTLDDHGCLSVTGRMDNMFISGGENIQPELIELALSEIDGVERAFVVPVEDDEFGHRPVAFVSTQDHHTIPDDDSLRSQLEDRLPHFMLPVALFDWPDEHADPDSKPDRAVFTKLAAKLNRG